MSMYSNKHTVYSAKWLQAIYFGFYITKQIKIIESHSGEKVVRYGEFVLYLFTDIRSWICTYYIEVHT